MSKFNEKCFWLSIEGDANNSIHICEYQNRVPECFIQETGCPQQCKQYTHIAQARDILRNVVDGKGAEVG